MSQKKELQLCALIILLGFFFGVFFSSWMRSRGYGYPYSTFLFDPTRAFSDFQMTYASTWGLNPYGGNAFASNYFPLAYGVFLPFTWSRAFVTFIIFYLIFFVFV